MWITGEAAAALRLNRLSAVYRNLTRAVNEAGRQEALAGLNRLSAVYRNLTRRRLIVEARNE